MTNTVQLPQLTVFNFLFIKWQQYQLQYVTVTELWPPDHGQVTSPCPHLLLHLRC